MSALSQAFPPKPKFTEKELPDQTGRVVIVTGSASGVGLALAKILYSKNATVYIGARSTRRANDAIEAIKKEDPSSKGRLEALVVDLADLSTVRPAVESFLAREQKLHVLVHNAGVMRPPVGSKSVQGHDLQMGTNCLGPFLLTRLLEPTLRSTARAETDLSSTRRGVRIVWVSSIIATSTVKGGIILDESGTPKVLPDAMENYMQTKVGNVFLGSEFAKLMEQDGILSVSLNPGLMKTELQRHLPAVAGHLMGIMFKPAIFGAYTELYAGFSPEVTLKENGSFFIPWGRKGPIPNHLEVGMRSTNDNGTGLAKKFYDWCESQTRTF